MTINLNVTWGTDDSANVTPKDSAVLNAAKRLGWTEKVPDPDHQRNIELKQAEVLQTEPGSPERAQKNAELQQLQQQGTAEIDNPVDYESFMVKHVRTVLKSLLMDEQSFQQEVQAYANAKRAEFEQQAESDLVVDQSAPS